MISEFVPSDRQLQILKTVQEGLGKWDTRWIDIVATTRFGPAEFSVFEDLKKLAEHGLVTRDTSAGVVGRWRLTQEGERFCADDQPQARPSGF